ncbi:helix-turn-helix domain-containing protein [Nocardia cyriacigeorgica]|uniref:helix-turn-helix domain-containing protein n=1 Tax=Nocardia cyriacigeorgica TaxID=135487 RepID=UPI002455A79E|nr:helix-turn-helix transcriptional regulator [Nocardia cyriacigeorgica]
MANRGELNRALCSEITDRRKRAGLTQKDMFLRAGLDKNVYRRVEYNQHTVSVEELEGLARALGVPADELLRAAQQRRDRDGAAPMSRAAREWRGALGFD